MLERDIVMERADVEKNVEIDEYQLDREWAKQPKLMLQACVQAAVLHRKVKMLKKKAKAEIAQVGLEIRRNPGQFGLVKATDAAVEAALAIHEDQQKTQDEIIKSEFELEVFRGYVSSLRDKKSALEDLVTLHLASYFAKPKVKGETDPEAVQYLEQLMARRRMARPPRPTEESQE